MTDLLKVPVVPDIRNPNVNRESVQVSLPFERLEQLERLKPAVASDVELLNL
jgi:hypothetical protein